MPLNPGGKQYVLTPSMSQYSSQLYMATLLWPHSQQNLANGGEVPYAIEPSCEQYLFTFTGSNSNPGCIWQPYSQQNLTKKPLNVDLFLPQWWGSAICHWTPVETVSFDTFNVSNSHPNSLLWPPVQAEPDPERIKSRFNSNPMVAKYMRSTICHWTQLGTVSVDTFNVSKQSSPSHPSYIWQPSCDPIPSRIWSRKN